jgi:AraC family transcriptional regulator, regulatory protein of adaptative response / methylated-DNA-[protein]-cysteine methyltransferase
MPLDAAATPFDTDDARYEAVRTRDRSADGRFWVGVHTTGVYCRPHCASRTPLRRNVSFYDSIEAARAAGLRACKRCRPDEQDRNAVLAADAARTIEAALERGEPAPSLAELAEGADLSRFHLQRVFKAATGLTPASYAAAARARRMRTALPHAASVTEAIYDAGYGSNGRFYESGALGMTPSAFRAGGVGETIRFAVCACSLGPVLTAATTKGVCAIILGDDPEAMVHDLQTRFPRATLVGADPDFERQVSRVVGVIEQPGTHSDLPLDVRGTAFQQRVWQALRAIPPGHTATYAEIATAAGVPAAVRAVANACGANPLAVAIPCHRVVRTDGGLGGYRWGIDRKRALLAREAV